MPFELYTEEKRKSLGFAPGAPSVTVQAPKPLAIRKTFRERSKSNKAFAGRHLRDSSPEALYSVVRTARSCN
jgi:hypothetical protein